MHFSDILPFLCLVSTAASIGSFGDDGLYKVIIEKSGLKVKTETEPAETPPAQTVTMFNRKGQPFLCSLPEKAKPISRHNQFNFTMEEIRKALGAGDPKIPAAKDCVSMLSNGWWHYEFCFSHKVSQFHIEGDRIVQPITDLGTFSHDFDWSQITEQDALKKTERAHIQFFVNGTECDLNGKRRSTRVKLYCGANTQHRSKDLILKVDEPESCVYEMTVITSRICKIEYFNKQPQSVGSVICNPVIDETKPKPQPQPKQTDDWYRVDETVSKTVKVEVEDEFLTEDEEDEEDDEDYEDEDDVKTLAANAKVSKSKATAQAKPPQPPPSDLHAFSKQKPRVTYDTLKRSHQKSLFSRGQSTRPPRSAAKSIHDVVNDMSPANQRLRTIQKLLAQQLGGAAAFMDVQVLEANGPPPNGQGVAIQHDIDDVFAQLGPEQLAQFQAVFAQAIAGQLGGLGRDHEAVYSLEDNYNMDGEEDDDSGASNRAPRKIDVLE
ncbi:putative Protein OS-9 [Hypsibius exemplaris]|uniref:MRH domain-containing protein n=1 Tax=Hypsibius exemplaris TaxID=2072580 RepID=A0A1W0XDZ0_HYPEX|nr:putative Protein OS-9 [Hypsibius exemplaris]